MVVHCLFHCDFVMMALQASVIKLPSPHRPVSHLRPQATSSGTWHHSRPCLQNRGTGLGSTSPDLIVLYDWVFLQLPLDSLLFPAHTDSLLPGILWEIIAAISHLTSAKALHPHFQSRYQAIFFKGQYHILGA